MMKPLPAYLNELINSGITLTKKETAIVEAFIEKNSKPVKPQHLNHLKCVVAARSICSD